MKETVKKIHLHGMNPEELAEFIESIGEKSYRANQILKWMNKGVTSIDEMTDLPSGFRRKLMECCEVETLKLHRKLVSTLDGTTKYLLQIRGGDIIECVLMKYHHGNTVCISSQAGCRMGCRFCASTLTGFSRNLETGEMVEQVIAPKKYSGVSPGNVVVMGIGEPFENYGNLLKFIRIINSEKGLNIGARKITVSTCGIVPGIIRLAGEGLQVNLSISLHAADDETRQQIMPINKKYSIDKIIGACKIYTGATNRRVTFEYILISGVNDLQRHAMELSRRLRGLLCHVNLIPMNNVEGSRYKAAGNRSAALFRKSLEEKGISVTIRRELGSDIKAACGQLRRSVLKDRE